MNLYINKRHKIIINTAILTIGLLSTQLVDFNLRFRFLAGLSVLSYALSLWSLWEGLNATKAFVLMILPTFFTVAVASFYFLLLAQNVFNVASLRTIPLYRAASTASFLFTLLSAFFIYHVIFAFNLLFLWNGVLVAAVSFPLILQVLWTIGMEDKIEVGIIVQSFVLSLILGELALSFSSWPSPTTIWSLSLSSAIYVLLGLTTQKLRGRLSSRVVWEYMGIGIAVLLISFITTSWAG